MGVLDRFLELQQQGMGEQDIINHLRHEGYQMKEIEDSINQAKIKSAVSQEPEQAMYNYSPETGYPAQTQYTQDQYAQTPTNISGEYPQASYQPYDPSQVDPNQADPNYGGFPQEGYEGYYPGMVPNSTDTITDIAEQVFSEKAGSLLKKVDKLVESDKRYKLEIEDLKERMKRIENSLDDIQKAIIGRIGEFGESTKMVQKDLDNIHKTLSKMMNPLIDNYNELKKLNSSKE